MESFRYTADEHAEYQRTLRGWVDTLGDYDDRQSFYNLAHDEGGQLHVCVLGALYVSLMEQSPSCSDEIYAYTRDLPNGFVYDAIGGAFVYELIMRNTCRQNGIPRGVAENLPWLNDSKKVTPRQFAAAINATMSFVAEHVEIIEEEPARDMVEV